MTMELESAKVLDNGQRIVLDMKRKRAACMADFNGATCVDAHGSVKDAPSEIFSKQIDSRMGSDSWMNNYVLNAKKSLLKNYSNYMNSGLPQRVLFCENGEWTDFSKGFIGLIKEDFRGKKVSIEVEFRGSPSTLDFLRMILVDLKTGLQRPIAWIDEAGICFFPEIYSISDAFHDYFQSGGRENHHRLHSQSNDTQEINLQLEIGISSNGMKMEDCSEGSNNNIKRLKIRNKLVKEFAMDQEASNAMKPVIETNEVIDENCPLRSVSPRNHTSGSLNGKLTSDAVLKMFIEGVGPSTCADSIQDIQHSSGYWAQARLELFEKQVEITEKYRGNANVRYAWLGSSKEAVSRILMHGLGFNEFPKTKPAYGFGFHLTSACCSHISANYCDVDENGVQHMVLCRVILGNMEPVNLGSEQIFPSSDNFDSGVNDILNPEHYIIWNMNMTTHIYPAYVVSFKRPSSGKGHASESSSKDGVSAVLNSSSCEEKLQQDNSPVDSVRDCPQTPYPQEIPQGKNSTVKFAGRPPKSAWMSFSNLFGAIEDKVPYSAMKLVYQYYDQFKNKKINRDELVQRMRWAVGDALLKDTIISLQGKDQGASFLQVGSRDLKVPKQAGTPYVQVGSRELKTPNQKDGTSYLQVGNREMKVPKQVGASYPQVGSHELKAMNQKERISYLQVGSRKLEAAKKEEGTSYLQMAGCELKVPKQEQGTY